MPLNERDAAYLWDMLDSAETVREFMKDVSYHQYSRDRKLQLAVERAVEIIGEAARRVSDTCKSAHPEIPWQGIIRQRNVLAHEYGDIKLEVMWVLATQRIPELIAMLKKLDISVPPQDTEQEK